MFPFKTTDFEKNLPVESVSIFQFWLDLTYYFIFSLPRNWVAMMTLRSRDFHPRRATMERSSVSDEFCVPIDCQQLWEKSVTGFWPTDSIFAASSYYFPSNFGSKILFSIIESSGMVNFSESCIITWKQYILDVTLFIAKSADSELPLTQFSILTSYYFISDFHAYLGLSRFVFVFC